MEFENSSAIADTLAIEIVKYTSSLWQNPLSGQHSKGTRQGSPIGDGFKIPLCMYMNM